MSPIVQLSPTAVPLERCLAARMEHMQTSAVREILKVAERPDILSLAGGLPAPELFPIAAIARAHATVLEREGAAALQYSVTEGYAPLREWLRARLAQKGVCAGLEQVLITSGAQQGIDLTAKVLLDKGDLVVVENPSYVAALQAFGGYEVELARVGSDGEGMRVDELEVLLARRRPKLIYVVPNFHNPTGATLSLERRLKLVALAARYGVPVLEDDPYGELHFRGEALPSLAALDEAGVVLQLSTFSKTLAPGLRLGWAVVPQPLARSFTIAKQATDLHSGTLAQRAAAELLTDGRFDFEAHLSVLRATYRERCGALLGALEQELPPGTSWTSPEGGLFVWVGLPPGCSADELLPAALARGVAFVPGSAFFSGEGGEGFLRLNFSNRPSAMLVEAVRRLRSALDAVRGGALLAAAAGGG